MSITPDSPSALWVIRKATTALPLALATMFVGAMPAQAVVPNDDRDTATVITSIPFGDTVDTTSATSDQGSCGEHTVWYKYPAPSVDTQLTFVLGRVVEGEGNLREPVVGFWTDAGGWCVIPGQFDSNFFGEVPAGSDAYITIGNDARGAPGLVGLVVFAADPINHWAVAINGSGNVNKNGTMTVSGTIGCERDDGAYLSVYAKQKSGHGYIYGETTMQGHNCTAPTSPWSIPVSPIAGGRFVPGRATIRVEVICPYGYACAPAQAERVVKLTMAK